MNAKWGAKSVVCLRVRLVERVEVETLKPLGGVFQRIIESVDGPATRDRWAELVLQYIFAFATVLNFKEALGELMFVDFQALLQLGNALILKMSQQCGQEHLQFSRNGFQLRQ